MPDERKTFTDEEALAFHQFPTPGKIGVRATKPMATQRDLSLAYSPGVAVPVLAIAREADLAYDYTSKGNLVAVISNGTAILGLGDLGALASKPVMEGKAVLFKRFADRANKAVAGATPAPDATKTAESTLRTSRAPSASASRPSCRSCSTSRCSTTTSTAPPSSLRRA